MSIPIRPLPFEAASQWTEHDAGSSTRRSGPFDTLLDLEIGSEGDESAPEESDSPDPWATLGAGSTSVPTPPHQEAPTAEPESGSAPAAERGRDEPIARPTNGGAESRPIASAALLKQLAPVAGVEQKLPLPTAANPVEIAAPPPKDPQIRAGTPAANEGAMMLVPEMSADESSMEQRADIFARPAFSEGLPVSRARFVESAKNETAQITLAELASPAAMEGGTEAAEVEVAPEVRAMPVLEEIQQQVQIVRVSQQRELQVVLRPDANTELFLHITRHDGQIQVHARCERGDFAWLESQWHSIQNSLGTQGIRVEPLEAVFRGENGLTPGFGDQRERAQQGPARPEPNLSFEQDTRRKSQPGSDAPVTRPSARGWQSWA